MMALGIAVFAADYRCLPSDIREDSVVRYVAAKSPKGETQTAVTVKQTLKTYRARCVRGKLVDRRGREIRFYSLQGCWGNPPADYRQILETQRKDLADLKKKYTVIEMTCSRGLPLQAIP
jgi:hypothetical protein